MTRPQTVLSLFLAMVALSIFSLWQWRQSQSESGIYKSPLLRPASAAEILNHIKGQHTPVTLVNFWASWCEPCKREFPQIVKLKKEWAGRGLNIVFVSVDEPQDAMAAEEFLKAQQVDFLTFYKGSQPLSFVTQIFPKWSGAIPASVLLAPDLELLDAWEGDASADEFKAHIRRHLKDI